MNFDLGNKTVLLPVKLDNEVLFSKAVQHRVRCVLAVDRDTQGSLTELSCGKHHRDSPRKTRYGAEDASALILFHGHAGFGAPIDKPEPLVRIVYRSAGPVQTFEECSITGLLCAETTGCEDGLAVGSAPGASGAASNAERAARRWSRRTAIRLSSARITRGCCQQSCMVPSRSQNFRGRPEPHMYLPQSPDEPGKYANNSRYPFSMCAGAMAI